MGKYQFLLIITFFYTLLPFLTNAQDIQPTRLVIAPTAGSLPSRAYTLETQLFDGGGVVQRITLGLTELVNIGVSFSGSNIIGSSRVVWQPHAGFQIRVRVIEESMMNPAIFLGFDSQGDGKYISGKSLNRFQTN